MKRSFLMLLAAAALVGCTKSELSEPVDGSLIALKSVTYTADATTRAPFVGTIGATNALTARVFAAKIADGGTTGVYTTNLHANGTMTFNSTSAATYDLASLGGVGNESKAKFPDEDAVFLFGVYPAAATADWDLVAGTAAFTFTGKEDVMGAKEVAVAKNDVEDGNFQTLAFNHLLTKLEVRFKTEAISATTLGVIQSVELIANAAAEAKVKNSVTFTAADGGVEFGGTVIALPFYGVTETGGVKTYTDVAYVGKVYEPTITSTLQAYAMVAPVAALTATTQEYFLRVTRMYDGTPQTPDIVPFDLMKADGTAFTGSTAGNAFTVVVNYIDKTNIKAVATVSEWVENGEYISNIPTN